MGKWKEYYKNGAIKFDGEYTSADSSNSLRRRTKFISHGTEKDLIWMERNMWNKRWKRKVWIIL